MTFAASRSSDQGPRGGTKLSDFFVLEKIGDGAYSEVFKVRRHTDGKIYALKKVSKPNN
jgi:serine/threonine protein kinase